MRQSPATNLYCKVDRQGNVIKSQIILETEAVAKILAYNMIFPAKKLREILFTLQYIFIKILLNIA